MKIDTCIKERRSVRKFLDNPVPHEVYEKIVDLARFSPSWKNSQTVRYRIVENKEHKSRIAETSVLGNPFNEKTINRASALVILTVVENISGYETDGTFSTPKEDRWEVFDAGIAAQTFCLAAHAHDVGTVIIGVFDEHEIKKIYDVPAGEKIIALIAAGYPQETGKVAPPRKEVEEILSFDE